MSHMRICCKIACWYAGSPSNSRTSSTDFDSYLLKTPNSAKNGAPRVSATSFDAYLKVSQPKPSPYSFDAYLKNNELVEGSVINDEEDSNTNAAAQPRSDQVIPDM